MASPHFSQFAAGLPLRSIDATPQHDENGVLLYGFAVLV
jgi:hypothetical protein